MTHAHEKINTRFLVTRVSQWVVLIAVLLTIVYFIIISFEFPIGNPWIFGLLIFGEIFHVFQLSMFLYTAWNMNWMPRGDSTYTPAVDVFITVAGEPVDIIEETVVAAKAMRYPNFSIYILNDGYVAKKDNWQEVEEMAKRQGVGCITRKTPGGAKAGNINNGVRQTQGEFIAIFDADHVPHSDFLSKMMQYAADPKVAFVQSPQYYKNYRLNYVTGSAWEQQELFFGPICKGKNRSNSATMCGTNMVIRRSMLLEVGGMSEDSIAEDFLTGMLLHSKGYRSVYVPEVLAEGLAPEDFLSYFKQQFRWGRGAFDVLFGYNLLFRRGLSFAQRMQYLSSVSFYFSGLIVAIDALIPVIYFFTGEVPLTISTMTLALVFLPYIFVTIYILQRSSNQAFTFRALTFSMAGFNIHLKALWAAILHVKSAFVVTPKRQQTGNFINLVIPHIVYIVLVVIGMGVALAREGVTASFFTNTAWSILNIAVFVPFIYAALSDKQQGNQLQT